jgi:hypothetical protein
MSNRKNYIILRAASYLMTLAYMFIVVAYLFFTPQFQYRRSSGNIKVKSNTQSIYTLIRTSRCMMNNKSVNVLVKDQIAHTTPLNFGVIDMPSAKVEHVFAFNYRADRQLSYLFNRVLRI